MIPLSQHPSGIVLPIRAQPGARRNGIVGEYNGALKIAVSAPPDDGKANRALLEFLAKQMGLKKSGVELLSGQASRDKKVLVCGATLDTIQRWLERVCGHADTA